MKPDSDKEGELKTPESSQNQNKDGQGEGRVVNYVVRSVCTPVWPGGNGFYCFNSANAAYIDN